jgi:hypothetical protein
VSATATEGKVRSMFYKLLGMLVWQGGKVMLRRKNGPTYVGAPLVAGAVVVAGLVAGLLFAKRSSD